ncbi:hypothetical protein OTK49_03240 [Vibrio coralliirubri]|uniref:hypothetical protein n=1 Tax=Vibrio coralliirubri TaxID=1516159 RepID=UPI002283375C|nr:hypothetical protein [Vibrio coralliirubri]MCY9861531.1 hypothetical protein [Vibrio coralliirubri]
MNNQETSIEDKAKAFDAICDMFSIGSMARSPSTLICNIENVIKFSDQLHAIEQQFFMVTGEPDEDEPYAEPNDECLLNRWGLNTEEYVSQFESAMREIEPFKSLLSQNAALLEQRNTLQMLLYSYASRHPEPNQYVIDALSYGTDILQVESECQLSIDQAIQKIESRHPHAHYQGFLAEKQPLLRDALVEKIGFQNQIGQCLRWFNENPNATPTKGMNPNATLGVVKHQVERLIAQTNKHHSYISRGAVLVAAVMCGYGYSKDKLHISVAALKFGTKHEN